MDVRPVVERLVAGTTETNSGCWEYGTSTRAYPTILFGVLRLAVHRAAYAIWQGALEHGQVLHHCDNPRCWRPDHLYDGTAFQNNRDRRTRATTYGRAGATNHFARLSEEQVQAIRAAADDRGMLTRARAREFAADYGVHFNTVYRAFTGQTWRSDTRTAPTPRQHWSKR